MKRLLRDGKTFSNDHRCGLFFEWEEVTEDNSLMSAKPPDGGIDLSKRPLINKVRIKNPGEPLLNQGELSACAGMAGTGVLEHEPRICTLGSQFGIDLYFESQHYDEFPGCECGCSEEKGYGTSLLAVLKRMKARGLITGWKWARTLEEYQIGVGYYGAAFLGLMWTEGMVYPDKNGFSIPVGDEVGGHATTGTIIQLQKDYVAGPNTWPGWNPKMKGFWKMHTKDFAKVLAKGQCAFTEKAIMY